jgi:hypothetical protein
MFHQRPNRHAKAAKAGNAEDTSGKRSGSSFSYQSKLCRRPQQRQNKRVACLTWGDIVVERYENGR